MSNCPISAFGVLLPTTDRLLERPWAAEPPRRHGRRPLFEQPETSPKGLDPAPDPLQLNCPTHVRRRVRFTKASRIGALFCHLRYKTTLRNLAHLPEGDAGAVPCMERHDEMRLCT